MLKYSNIKSPSSRKTGLRLHSCFPRYEILEKLGEGGVAVVYKVMDRKGGANKALKVLKPEHNSSARAVERFKDEFRILRSLHHPGLPEMYDFGYSPEGGCYMVMELVQGEPIDRYLTAHRDELWILLRQIVEALEFIHEHDLLHLDFKPGNVLVRRTKAFGGVEAPLVTLIDFGLSFRRESGGEVRVVGTPEYIAPEIISGDERITRAADYYSLGAAIYELIEGKPPFTGKADEVLRAHLSGEIAFGKEKVEYAELYPRVRALLDKDIGRRLEAFGDFRRSLSARTEEEIRSLSRAYGMGYIESLGAIGRDGLRQELRLWVEGISRELKERLQQKPLFQASGSLEADQSKISAGKQRKSNKKISNNIFDLDEIQSSADLEKRIKEDLLSSMVMNGDERERHSGPAKDIARVATLSGAEGSGKSYILGVLRNECLLEGMSIFSLGNGGDYEEIVMDRNDSGPGSANPPRSVDPRSMIIDRFVNGWERLKAEGAEKGAMLVADGYDELEAEEKEFLEYVGKRLELDLGGKKEPGVFIIVSGRRPKLKKLIGSAVPAGAKAKELIVPLPAKEDVEKILAEFHGRMPGANDRKRLGEYLSRHTQSIGALLGSLREAVAAGELERDQGKWRFLPAPSRSRKQKDEGKSYYRILYDEMERPERELVSWLCCHRGFLDRDDFLAISEMPSEQLDIALEKMRPYRLVDTRDDKNSLKLGIPSEIVRKELYKAIGKPRRLQIHLKYLAHFEIRTHELEKQSQFKGSRGRKSGKRKRKPKTAALHVLKQLYDSMGLHFEQSGQMRSSLLMRVKAVKILKQERDVFGLRKICEESIKMTRRLRGKKWANRKWHLERYFIKEWIEAEWMVDNYRGLKEVVRKHIYARKRELPISFAYKYGMVLSRSGEMEACKRLLYQVKKKTRGGISETYVLIRIVEAAFYYSNSSYKKSLKVLEQISKLRKLAPFYLVRIYIYLMLNCKYLSMLNKFKKYHKLAEDIAGKYKLYDELYTTSNIKTIDYFVSSLYTKAKSELKVAMKLAINFRVYRRLYETYFLASAIYYEEGAFTKALNYLGKAIQLASNLGLDKEVAKFAPHYALIYQQMGNYGDAIHHAEYYFSHFSREKELNELFYSVLIMFDLYISLNTKRSQLFRRKANALSHHIETVYRLAYYHSLLGRYYFQLREYSLAYKEYQIAKRLFIRVNQDDDVVRSYYGLIYVNIETGKFKEAAKLLQLAKKEVSKMESVDLKAEYYRLMLAYYYMTRNNNKRMTYYLKSCENIRANIKDVQIAMNMDILLFRVNARIGKSKMALNYILRYNKKIKEIISNLNDKNLADEFINNNEIMNLIKELCLVKNKTRKPRLSKKQRLP